jgi:hypothetical protein
MYDSTLSDTLLLIGGVLFSLSIANDAEFALVDLNTTRFTSAVGSKSVLLQPSSLSSA